MQTILRQFQISTVPILNDNFSYIIFDKLTRNAAIIDPAEPYKVIKAITELNVIPKSLWLTHHHLDHAGGNEEFLKHYKDMEIKVIGGDKRIAGINRLVHHEESWTMDSMTVTALHTPCHTTGSTCFWVKDSANKENVVFTGDTLFVAGCGRFFEGNAKDMYHSLINVLCSLPDETLVFAGHEYTAANLKFAASIEPENDQIKVKIANVRSLLEKGMPTVPSTMQEEKKTNPFLRVNETKIQKIVKASDSIQAMNLLRELKNNFK